MNYKIKGVKVHIPINGRVKPVQQPYRRIPIHLQLLVEQDIARLLRQDKIEEVNEQSGWQSPLVIVKKAPNKVRICVYMRMANTAIIKEKYPMPALETLTA